MVWPPNKKTRMSNAHWPKIMLSYNVTGVYSRGHPKKTKKKRRLDSINNMKEIRKKVELAFKPAAA